MTSLAPILLATLVHLVLNTTVFIQLNPEILSETPIFGSQLFYLSVLELLCHFEVLPKHWSYMPPWSRFICETIAVFLISEMSMALVWLTLETVVRQVIFEITTASGILKTSYRSQKLILEIITVSVSIVFTVIVAAVTNQPSKVSSRASRTGFVHQEGSIYKCSR